MTKLFDVLLYQPLLNLLVFLYNILPNHDLGLAIIILTIIVRLILWPLSQKAVKAQKTLKELQPKLKTLQEKYKNDKQKLANAIIGLYQEHKINPFFPFILILIQLPILIAVYRVFWKGLKTTKLNLYSFIYNPGALNPLSFGFLDLSKPNLTIAIITGFIQYWQTKMLIKQKPASEFVKKGPAKDENMMAIINRQMSLMMPILTVFIGLTLPSGLMLYWLVGLLLTILQQKISFQK